MHNQLFNRRDFKEVGRLPMANGSARFRTIQICPKDLVRDWQHSRPQGRQVCLFAIRRCAMNMSVTQFVVPPAIVARSRSVWHQIIDTVIEAPSRTAADEVAEYLTRHQYDLSPTLRIELERRHVCV
jgi:hypothetical protein